MDHLCWDLQCSLLCHDQATVFPPRSKQTQIKSHHTAKFMSLRVVSTTACTYTDFESVKQFKIFLYLNLILYMQSILDYSTTFLQASPTYYRFPLILLDEERFCGWMCLVQSTTLNLPTTSDREKKSVKLSIYLDLHFVYLRQMSRFILDSLYLHFLNENCTWIVMELSF